MDSQTPAIELAQMRRFFPDAATIAQTVGAQQLTPVLGADQQVLGAFVTTSPAADNIVGYAGPSNSLIVVDSKQKIVAASLLASRDTHDHVRLVQQSSKFWSQFEGWQFGSATSHHVDGVSGATLTSLAIAESIIFRLQGTRQSLRFPNEVTLAEIQGLRKQVAQLTRDNQQPGRYRMLDEKGELVTYVLRTGNVVDAIEGYQGPSELLLFLDDQQRLIDVKLRSSFDNQPYIRYVQQEIAFWSKFKGKSLLKLAALDFEAAEIEGVSGATMTSMAAARTLQATSRYVLDSASGQTATAKPLSTVRWSGTEITTALLALCSMIWSRLRLRAFPTLRVLWQVACLVIIGLISGNLLSLALLTGWSSGGIPFRLAPGLSILLLLAYGHSFFFKMNVYCDHLCPHGILQQWLARWKSRGRSRRDRLLNLPVILETRPQGLRQLFDSFIARGLPVLAWSMVLMCLLAVRGGMNLNVASWEPFDAYSWRLGLSLSMLVWILSLALSWYKPMSYCRLGCPTGKTLDYVRSGPNRWKIEWMDLLLLMLLAYVWLGG